MILDDFDVMLGGLEAVLADVGLFLNGLEWFWVVLETFEVVLGGFGGRDTVLGDFEWF